MKHKALARYPIGNPRRVWRQDRFLLSIANPGPYGLDLEGDWIKQKTRRAVRTAVDAGFDIIGTVWTSPEISQTILQEAEALGAQISYQNLKRMGGMGDRNRFSVTSDLEGCLKELTPWRSATCVLMWDEPMLEEHLAETRAMKFCRSAIFSS